MFFCNIIFSILSSCIFTPTAEFIQVFHINVWCRVLAGVHIWMARTDWGRMAYGRRMASTFSDGNNLWANRCESAASDEEKKIWSEQCDTKLKLKWMYVTVARDKWFVAMMNELASNWPATSFQLSIHIFKQIDSREFRRRCTVLSNSETWNNDISHSNGSWTQKNAIVNCAFFYSFFYWFDCTSEVKFRVANVTWAI